MKNVLIYISPTGSFNNPRRDLASNDAGPLVKVQIENSEALGWNKQDIMLFTNFDFEYAGVRPIRLKDIEFFDKKPQASKINTIVRLFEKKYIKKNELYWFHDLDAFQLEPITEREIPLAENEIALTDFAGGKYFKGKPRWSTGVIFFKSGSHDIFSRIKDVMYQYGSDEEEALSLLTLREKEIAKRVIKLNNTFNFVGYNFPESFVLAQKPLKVAHFHPLVGKRNLPGIGKESALRFFKGENMLNMPLVSKKVVKLLKYHRIG